MATELKHTVKPTGGDYNTLSAAIDHIEAAHANLVTSDVYALVEIDGTWSSADTTAVTIHNITTDATRYLKIYTTAAARHKGIWSTSYYQLVTSNATAMTCSGVSYVWVDGLQIGHSSVNANFQNCVYFTGTVGSGANQLLFSNTITRGANNNSYRNPSYQAESTNQAIYLYNCIDYGHGTDANNYNTGFFIGNGTATIYSSTIIGGYTGIYRGGGTIVSKNTYARGSSAAWLGTGASLTMTNCAASDATAEDTDPQDSVANDTDTFVNVTYATADYHLAADGLSPLKGVGVNTSGDSAPMNFTTDIDGDARDATWDIGADAWVVSGATISNAVCMVI